MFCHCVIITIFASLFLLWQLRTDFNNGELWHDFLCVGVGYRGYCRCESLGIMVGREIVLNYIFRICVGSLRDFCLSSDGIKSYNILLNIFRFAFKFFRILIKIHLTCSLYDTTAHLLKYVL
jgi:hypothetical protein